MQTYEAILTGDRLEWVGDRPEEVATERSVRVQVTVPGIAGSSPHGTSRGSDAAPGGNLPFKIVSSIAELEPWTEEQWQPMAKALDRIAASGELSGVDGVAWQRAIRQDRSGILESNLIVGHHSQESKKSRHPSRVRCDLQR